MQTQRALSFLSAPCAAALLAASLVGCRSDLTPYRVPREAVGSIEPLHLPLAATLPASRPATAPAPEQPVRVARLSLGEARQIALENNLDLAASRIAPRIASAELSAEEAVFETFFAVDGAYVISDSPTALEINASQSEDFRLTPALVQPLPTGGEIRGEFFFDRLETTNPFATLNPSYETDTRFSLNQPLARGFGSDASEQRIRIAATQLGQALVRQKLDVIETLAAVDRAYWALYAARRAVDVRQQQVDLAQEQLARAQRMFEAGQSPEVEVVRARSGLADARELLIQASADANSRQRALQVLLNADRDSGIEIGGPVTILTQTQPVAVRYELNVDQLAEMALGRRMELLEAELLIAEQQINVLAARNAARPRVDLSYTYGINGLGGSVDDSLDVMRDVDYEDHILGWSVEIPLGNRARREQLRAAVLQRVERLLTYESRRLLVRQEVLDAAADVESAWLRIGAAQDRVDAAQRLLEAEERQFNLGTRTSTEVLEVQTNLAAARLSLIEALADYEIARTNLAAATGTILGKSGVELELPR